jgi:hypothetical protein
MAISSTEEDFLAPSNQGELSRLVGRTERLRLLLGAQRKTFAGVLPGVLYARRIVRESPETDLTAEVVVRAERKVRDQLGWSANHPVVVLGGRGFVGRRLVRRFQAEGRNVHVVDLKGDQERGWPDHLEGRRAILVNAARRDSLVEYLPRFWPELVLLNEVYPEPGQAEISLPREIGSVAFHVAGVAALCIPAFPGAYSDGIPCCAAMPDPAMEVKVYRVV